MLPSAAGGTDLYMSAGFRRLYPFYLRRNEEPIMKTGTIVAIILATAGAVIATVAFMQRKRLAVKVIVIPRADTGRPVSVLL